MSNRLKLVLVLGTLIVFSLTMAACNRERPAPATTTGTPAARGTVAGPTAVAPAITQVAVPTAMGAGTTSASTPSAPAAGRAVTTPAAPGAMGSGEASTYTVAAGDTLLSIATRFGTTTEALVQLNNLPDPDALTLGQELKIPGAGATTETSGETETATTDETTAAGGSTTYTVVQGDTLGSIAQRFGTTTREIVSLNHLADPDSLTVGQKLTIPGGSGGADVTAPTGGQSKTYVIERGDTLLSIARRFGLTVQQLQDANNISNPDRIYPGQTLVIP